MAKVVGSGQHSHEVPDRDGVAVEMRDGGHAGTAIYWSEVRRQYVAVHYDSDEVTYHGEIVLVRGGDWDTAAQSPIACDAESPLGLAFYDYAGGSLPEGGEVIWSSRGEPRHP